MKKAKSYMPRAILKYIFIFLAALFIFLSLWLDRKFGSVTLKQIIYHMQFGSKGLLTADPKFITSFIRSVVLASLYATIAIWILESLTNPRTRQRIKNLCDKLFSKPSRLLARGMSKFPLRSPNIPVSFAVFFFAGSLGYFLYDVSFFSGLQVFFDKSLKEDYYAANYISPSEITLKEKQPKNLVLIYVESFENTYSDKNLFGKDLIEPLTSLKNSSDAFSFSSFTQMPGTGWTIAGIVASQCGVPLKSMTVFNPNQQGEQVSNFLSSAVCLGDVLSQNSYKNVYMRGASLKFAGADKFFSTHGYTELYGRENWLEKGYRPEHMNNWGLYDDDLFYEAEKKLTELIDSGERFNLTLLTVDAHHPSGYLSKTCARDGDKNFSGVLTCTARQVSNFIDLIEERGWSDKVNVIVMGDHLAMRNKFYDKIRQNPQRTIFNLFISKGRSFDKSRENVTHFDMFPTILQFMGFDVSGGRLALGFSALKRDGNMTPPEDYQSVMINSLRGRSDFYNSLWLPATGELDEPENPPPYRR